MIKFLTLRQFICPLSLFTIKKKDEINEYTKKKKYKKKEKPKGERTRVLTGFLIG
jgi:hypothetical protein